MIKINVKIEVSETKERRVGFNFMVERMDGKTRAHSRATKLDRRNGAAALVSPLPTLS